MATLLHRLGLASARHRTAVVLVWFLVLVAGGTGALTLAGTTSTTFSIPGLESTRALTLLTERFGAGASGGTAQVVLRAPVGEALTDPARAAEVARAVRQLGALQGVASASDPLAAGSTSLSADRRTGYSTVTYRVQASSITDAQHDALLAVVDRARSSDLVVEVTGDAATATTSAGATEGIGVVVALLVLALTYGSLVAAGMNLVTAIVGVGIGATGITTLTGFVTLSSTTPALALMLGLAVGIDYALFIVTRYRQELRDGRDVPTAAARATGTAGSAVVTAGLTVVIALAGLAVVRIPFLTQMGLAAAATVVVAVLVAVTLVPAALALVGTRALPRRQRAALRSAEVDRDRPGPGERGGAFGAWVSGVVRWRWPVLVVAVVALGVLAVPVASLRTSLAVEATTGTTQARAQAILDDSFGAGTSAPLLVLVDGSGASARAATVAAAAARLDDVLAVGPPVPDAAGTAAVVTVVPRSGPSSQATVDLVHALREQVTADRPGQPRAYVTGTTAVSVDVGQRLSDALVPYLVLVVGLALLLLVLVFRSILVPVVGVVGFLLALGASLGATTAVFQWGWLAGPLHVAATGPLISVVPILVIGILFGLAMDYQVFLVSRIHEAHRHGSPARAAISAGFRSAAPVVLTAAVIMFGVFAGFVPGGDATIQSIGFSLAVGVLADAVVVRMVVMPAALAILGRAAWWFPRWLRWLPALDIEGSALERPAPSPGGREREEPAPAGAGR